jgi:epoxyqueuosine reductase
MSNHIFGCDDCLDVCPFNLRADQTADAAFLPSATTLAPHLNDLAELSREEFADRFTQSPVRRAKWEGLRRNIAIAKDNEASRSRQVHAPLPSLTK